MLDGKITISMNSDGVVTITLQDTSSVHQVVSIEMTPSAFSRAILGEARIECKHQLNLPGIGKAGLVREVKTEYITIPASTSFFSEKERTEIFKTCAKEFEVDGWVADEHSLNNFNHHRMGVGNKYKMSFKRYLPATNSPT